LITVIFGEEHKCEAPHDVIASIILLLLLVSDLLVCVQGALILGIKQPRYEADHSPPSEAEVKNAWSSTSTPHASSWRGA
jgi:hypothetical protein